MAVSPGLGLNGLPLIEERWLKKASDEGELCIANIMPMHHVTAGAALMRRLPATSTSKMAATRMNTGRNDAGPRCPDGSYQAVKNVIQNENQTLASITFQNQPACMKTGGMTGTFDTEAEFSPSISWMNTLFDQPSN